MSDPTELDPDELREQIRPDVDGVDPADLTVKELRYAVRACLDHRPDQRPLRQANLVAALDRLGGDANATMTVAALRNEIVQLLGGVSGEAIDGATPLPRAALVALCEELR